MIRMKLRLLNLGNQFGAVGKQAISLALSVMTSGVCLFAPVPQLAMQVAYAGPVERLDFTPMLKVPNGHRLVSVSASNEDLRKVLHDIAQSSGLNLMMAESVKGKITIELIKVSLNDALQAIATTANLDIVPKEGNIYLAIAKTDAKNTGLDRGYSKVIKVNYANATRIASVLNASMFNTGSNNTGAAKKVLADARTNSLVLVGTPHEIYLAEQAIAKLDMPRQSKTFYLSNSNAVNVASMLASGVFNEGTAQFNVGGGGGASGGGNSMVPATPSQLTAEQEKIKEGSGVDNFGGQTDESTAGLGQSITLRAMVKESTNISVSPEGPIIIPDTRTNAVTIMGTAEQISLAESMIPILDAQLPQVSIEVSLVELSEVGSRNLGVGYGIGQGKFQAGWNNASRSYNSLDPSLPVANQQEIGIPTQDASLGGFGALGFTTSPVTNSRRFALQVDALIQAKKAKVLANPTVVATHDSESVISIVDEIIRRTTIQQSSSVNGLTTREIEIGEVGIVLDILPKVGEDGTVTMRIRPSISTIRDDSQTDTSGNAVTLLSKRDLLAQSVRVRDGETIVLGGLIKDTDAIVNQKFPGLADMPILGAMFRASRRVGERSELVMMVTPHIMNKVDLTPVNFTQTSFQNQK